MYVCSTDQLLEAQLQIVVLSVMGDVHNYTTYLYFALHVIILQLHPIVVIIVVELALQ